MQSHAKTKQKHGSWLSQWLGGQGFNTTTPGHTTVVNTVVVSFDKIDAIVNTE